ncbi:glycosyltransferase [Streptomyces sp. DSM 41640]|uniref:Glycosyltransferase n=1 Tax=Streptomyces doebereineriae TaxID=3075528 RepID=A0ABU2V202_9ACTN|nr:glycosyltransferase [Streptomyces sp. DSM 41640]MDT0479588.1 glycosyltransferase [Streptomyces sp. DSM 41640]
MTTSPATQSEAETTSATVDVVLPCPNEAEALPWVLARIPRTWRALVVDNGSTDGSPELARDLGATVVRETRRCFGAACHAGLTAATADIVCFCDCDAQAACLMFEAIPRIPGKRGDPSSRTIGIYPRCGWTENRALCSTRSRGREGSAAISPSSRGRGRAPAQGSGGARLRVAVRRPRPSLTYRSAPR